MVLGQLDTGELDHRLLTDEPAPIMTEPGELNPVLEERMNRVPEPVHLRTPAVIHYPRLNARLVLLSGNNVPQVQFGFKARSIVVQNVGGNAFLFCPELNLYLTSAATPMATYNLPYGFESLSFEWHTALFNNAPPAAVTGQYAIIWAYDEWVLPATAASGSGGATASATAAQTNVAQNAANVQLLAANNARKDASIFNDSTANLFISFSGPASLTNFKVKIAAGGYWSMQPGAIFTGQINGIWDAAGAGAARVTELT